MLLTSARVAPSAADPQRSSDGLNRFDGYDFAIYRYDPDDPSTLRDDFIESVYEDRSGVLWIGTQASWLERYDSWNDRFTHYHITEELQGKKLLPFFGIALGWTWLLWLVILISACGRVRTVEVPAAGDILVENRDLSGFDQVEVAGFFEAEIVQGESYRVVVEAERALLPYLEIEVRGGRLRVGLKPGINYSFEDASQRVEVTLPALTRARIGNHSTLQLTGFTVEESLRLEPADFSTLRGSIEAEKVQIEASNHSSLILTGSASQVMREVTNYSSADLTGLEAAALDIATDTHSSLTQ